MDADADTTDAGPAAEGAGVPPAAGYSSVLDGCEEGAGGGEAANGRGSEYPGVPGVEERNSTPPPEPDPDDFWQRMVATGNFKTVEKARDALDRRDWREVERAKQLAERARQSPGREVAEGVGRVARRTYRQVNVKLSEPDFASLKALAIERDVPPATMARMLMRQAIADSAKG